MHQVVVVVVVVDRYSSLQSLTNVLIAIVVLIDAIQLKVAASEATASERTSSEGAIDRPAHRATSFVPRLGKREQLDNLGNKLNLDQIICATGYNGECSHLLDSLQESATTQQRLLDQVARRDSNLLALIGSLARGIITQGGSLRLAPPTSISSAPAAVSDVADEMELLDLMRQQQQIKREPRASDDARGIGEMLTISNGLNGNKRVAFTPRIGR